MPTENQPITLDTLMEQAQVFASSWSLVGCPFDNGNQMEQAKQEKADLRQMLEQFARQSLKPAGKPYDGLVAGQQEETPPIGIDSEGGSHD